MRIVLLWHWLEVGTLKNVYMSENDTAVRLSNRYP